MALTTLTELVELLKAPLRAHADKLASLTGHDSAGLSSYWTLAGVNWPAGAVPPVGAGEAPSRTTLGAFPAPAPPAGEAMYLAAVVLAQAATGPVNQATTFCDRLVHTSGLSGNISTAQAVNTAALTRHTSGQGVEMFLEIYTAVGATAQSVLIDYTNQDGVAKQTNVTIGGTAASAASTMLRVPLASGDSGVRSVQSVTLPAGTGTVGNFGITLVKWLWMTPHSTLAPTIGDWADLGLPEVDPNACVAAMGFQPSDRAALAGHLDFVAA